MATRHKSVIVHHKIMQQASVLMPNFEKKGGLVTVVVQDKNSKEVLMVAFTNKAGFLETLATGEAVFFSTSRNKRWKKGETSGNKQIVTSVKIDCDCDAIIYEVTQLGEGACHTGKRTCFYRSVLGSVLFTNKQETIKVLPVHPNIS